MKMIFKVKVFLECGISSKLIKQTLSSDDLSDL